MVFLMLATAWIGDADGAAELAHDSIARIRRSLPADHPDTLRLSAYVALAFSWAGDTAGRPLAEDLLRRSRSVLGPNHSTTLLAATDLSIGLLWEGDPATIHRLAADTYRRAVDNLGNDHLITLGSAAVFAQALVWTGAADRIAGHRAGVLGTDRGAARSGPFHHPDVLGRPCVGGRRLTGRDQHRDGRSRPLRAGNHTARARPPDHADRRHRGGDLDAVMTIRRRETCWRTPSPGSAECSGRSIRWPSACRCAMTSNPTDPPFGDHACGPAADARLPLGAAPVATAAPAVHARQRYRAQRTAEWVDEQGDRSGFGGDHAVQHLDGVGEGAEGERRHLGRGQLISRRASPRRTALRRLAASSFR